jgi:hypothetical protein
VRRINVWGLSGGSEAAIALPLLDTSERLGLEIGAIAMVRKLEMCSVEKLENRVPPKSLPA